MSQTNLEEEKIQELLGQYLKLYSTTEDSKKHLNEDFLNSFIEGRLSQSESSLVLQHLSRCSFCLHVTAELTKLEYAMADEKIPVMSVAQEPQKISEVLSGLLSKVFGSSDDAVFANQEDKEEPKKEE